MANSVSEAVMKAVYLLLLFSAFVMFIKKKMRSNGPLWRKEEGCSSPVEEKKQRLQGVSEKRVKIKTWEPLAYVEISKLLRREQTARPKSKCKGKLHRN